MKLKKPAKQEFDAYIHQYRSNLDKALSLSGESSEFFAQYKAQKLFDWMKKKIPAQSHLLDFGCGDGIMTQFVKRAFPRAKVYGIDPSPKSIAQAKEQFAEIEFSTNSEETQQIEFQDGFFDLVFTAGVMHHIPFEKHAGYIQEMHRILKPQGYLVIFELNPMNPLTVLTFKRNPIDQNAKMMWPWYSKKLTTGWAKNQIKYYCFFPRFLNWMRPFEPMLTRLPVGALYASISQK